MGEWKYSSTSALVGGEWSASRLGRFTPEEEALYTPFVGGWMNPTGGLEAVPKRKKIPAPAGNRIPVVQHIVTILNEVSRLLLNSSY
jgi:hypothetical protein